MKVKRINLENWSEFLTDSEMKSTLGGYAGGVYGNSGGYGDSGGYGYDDDTIYGPYQLPEVVVTCGQDGGKCWDCQYVHVGGFSGNCRYWTGKQSDSCSASIKCKDLVP